MLRSIFRAILFVLVPLLSIAQPPAQGPGLPRPGNIKELGTFVVLNPLEETIQHAIDTANMDIQKTKDSTGVEAHVSFEYIAYAPRIVQTTFTDRPNQNVATMYLMITYHVSEIKWHHISYSDRSIGQTVTITARCDNWSFPKMGIPKVVINAEQPYLNGNSFDEEFLNFFCSHILSDIVDKKIGNRIYAFQRSLNVETLAPCNCIAVDVPTEDSKENHWKKSSFDFGYNPPARVMVTSATTGIKTETVSLTSVKRLAADDNHNNILYQQEENVNLILYVNQSAVVVPLGVMHENDIKTFSDVKVSFPKPTSAEDMVVVIANIQQNDNVLTTNSGYDVYKKATNFGNGKRSLVVEKSYWQQPIQIGGGAGGPGGVGSRKPIQMFVKGYEITLNVVYPLQVLTQ